MARWPFDAFLFDLDDTLFDTSGQLVPAAHREAALAMVQAGLDAPVEQVFALRCALARLPHAVDVALDTALRLRAPPGQLEEIVQAGHRAFFERQIGPLTLDPGVQSLLEVLKAELALVLITLGHPPTQREKVAALGLEPYFRQIDYVDRLTDSKLAAFSRLLKLKQWRPERCVVIGDRPDAEIAAGRQFGMFTVRVLGGEHVHQQEGDAHERAHLSIERVTELPERLDEWLTRAGRVPRASE